MTLNELLQFDLKDLKKIDYRRFIGRLKSRPDIIVAVLTMVVTMIICFLIYSGKKKELDVQLRDIEMLQQRDALFVDLQAIKQGVQALKGVLPAQISESDLIDIITQAATDHGITISAFSPTVRNDHGAYAALTLSLTVVAPLYHELWGFIYRIESENRSLRIDSWSSRVAEGARSVRRVASSGQAGGASDPNMIEAALTVTVINFKHE